MSKVLLVRMLSWFSIWVTATNLIGQVTLTGADLVEFLTLPYLQNVKPNGITIMWELDSQVVSQVEYGIDETYGEFTPATVESSGFNTFIYRCVLTGLSPGLRYHFRVVSGGNADQDRSFRTAPDGPADFSFGVWSDSQGFNRGAYPPDPLEPTKRMMAHLAESGVDFAVTAGDLAENGNAYQDTRDFYLDRIAKFLGQTVPWFVAWGNHDGSRSAVLRKFADMPSKDRPGFDPGYGSFSFDYGGCHFICIDFLTMRSDIDNWLESDLQSPANRDARFTFLFVHVPPYCEVWIDGDGYLRANLVPLMEQYGVDACFSGHTHEYSRGFLHHVHYCVTGGGSWLDLTEPLVADWEHMTVGGQHSIPGVSRPGPNRGGGLINEYVRVQVDQVSFEAFMEGFEPDGKSIGVLDSFGSSLPIIQVYMNADRDEIQLTWIGGSGPFQLQKTAELMDNWENIGNLRDDGNRSVAVPIGPGTAFYRVLEIRPGP